MHSIRRLVGCLRDATNGNAGSREEFELFRDHLLTHLGVVCAYADLTRKLAQEFDDDIRGFRDAKHPCVRAVLATARAEGGASSV